MPLHPELQGLLTAVDAVEADARSLASGLSDPQGNWQPGGGTRWSVVQCLDHLAKMNHFYVEHFRPVVDAADAGRHGPFAGLRPTLVGRWFVRSLEPPVTVKAKARPNVLPALSMPLSQALAAYVASHAPYRQMVEAANLVDVNRVNAPNPILPLVRMRIATVLQIVPAHDRRHLWQARQVLADPAFPR